MKKMTLQCITTVAILQIVSCTGQPSADQMPQVTEILVTSESGDRLAQKDLVQFTKGTPNGFVVQVFPKQVKQVIDGIGSSFTESSAYVLAHLEESERKKVMENIYGQDGANFSLTRTHIGACDFCVVGKYSYADRKDDVNLESFTIAPDKEGFERSRHPGIMDETYDLLPMIKEALSIKNQQKDQEFRIIGSAWTAPSWMKDIEDWYIPGTPENNHQGTGGSLKKEYESSYAAYIVRYLDAYAAEGVPIWGLTPVNEPHGNNGQWESMHFTPNSQNDFIKNHLGPKLRSSRHPDTKLLVYDQNRDGLEHWTDVIFNDPETSPYVYGAAVHWYESTVKVYEDVLGRVNARYPEMAIIHTEGCIDDLGKPAPPGILDPVKFKEEGWFDNDAFWWNPNATDWGYTAPWEGVIAEDHQIYTPVHRYARNIIVSLDNWLKGWVDWNIVLDHNGGPNHAGNYCGAPIMINTATKQIYYTPIYYVLAQFSRTIRPGDQAVQTQKRTPGLDADALHACATINMDNLLSVQLLNTTKSSVTINLQIGERFAVVDIPANAVQTVRIML